MGDFCKPKDVMVMQGDILEVYFELDGIAPEAVKTVYFSSDKANLLVYCPYSQFRDGYCLRIGSEYTELMRPIICSYDLTVEFYDGNRITVIHEGCFAVLKKRNFIEEDDDGSSD